MMESAPNRRFTGHKWLRLLALAVAVVLIYVASVCLHIVQEASQQETHPADAIVVFGAAEYAGRPSPVYRARLDHAFELFKRGIAPVVIATGGAGDDLHFTEGGVGRDYLMRRGIAEPNLIAETQGSDTAQSAERVGVIMRANHMHSCIAVSDAYLSLPPGSADWPVTADGRTGLRLLEDQLELLERNLDEISGHAWRRGVRRLLAHERFLEDRLGLRLTKDLELPR